MTKSIRTGTLALAGALLFCAPAGVMAQSGAVAGAAKPRISAPVSSHDFGEIWEGDLVTHTFTIRNTGDAELHILAAKGS